MKGKRLSPRRVAREERVARRRRSPEVARTELLDAAEKVFVEFQPDQVGLKDVAREAGTSHALITHYFGTYAGLIEATLERRIAALREAIRERVQDARVLSRPEELISILFRALEDPVHTRLVRWLLASERPSATHAFALQANGIQMIAQAVAAAVQPNPSREVISKVELAMLTSVAAAYGYAMCKHALAGAAGRTVSLKLDEDVQSTLTAMVKAHIKEELGALVAR